VNHVASILRAEEEAMQEISMKRTASELLIPTCITGASFSRLQSAISQNTGLANYESLQSGPARKPEVFLLKFQ
jgi:hypothetical protein